MIEGNSDWFVVCRYCGSEMPEQEHSKFTCPLCGWEHDHDAYLRKRKITAAVGYGHKDFALHPDLVGWPRFLLCGLRMRVQPDFSYVVQCRNEAES